MSAPLTNEEAAGIQDGRFPSLRLAADQWGEYGYFYDPVQRRFSAYEIDRKEQTDGATALGDAAAVRSHVHADNRAAVEAWLASLPRTACSACAPYLGEWRSHGPAFPDEAFEVIAKVDIEVGTHGAVSAMEGTARCRRCGLVASFGCVYGPGYWLTPAPPT